MKPCAKQFRHFYMLWIAGQMYDMRKRRDRFVWRVKTRGNKWNVYPMTYTYWARGQPSYWVNEKCIQIFPYLGSRWNGWNDRACGLKTCFVCESFRWLDNWHFLVATTSVWRTPTNDVVWTMSKCYLKINIYRTCKHLTSVLFLVTDLKAKYDEFNFSWRGGRRF